MRRGTSISEGDPPFGKAIDEKLGLMSNHFGDLARGSTKWSRHMVMPAKMRPT